MKQPTWIWYYGDFEIRECLRVNSLRYTHEFYQPAPWQLDDCHHAVTFRKKFSLSALEKVLLRIDGVGNAWLDGTRYPVQCLPEIAAGEHELVVHVSNIHALPAMYLQGETLVSDGSFEASFDALHFCPVGFWNLNDPETPPSRFSLPREPLALHRSEENGIPLYDAGRETFCALTLRLEGEGEGILYLGESMAEVMSDAPYIWFRVKPDEQGMFQTPPSAFRYLRFAGGEGVRLINLQAEYEYLPLPMRGRFSCSDPLINRIYEVAEYTLRLNSREFYLDGIKRDRYLWSGDAYQSYLLNYYSSFDNAICRRTMIALGGNSTPQRHINTINDYTCYWLMAFEDYFRHTGDLTFLDRMYPRMETWLDFILERTDEDGQVVDRPGDWVFIDWLDTLEKQGPVSFEQMLLILSLRAMAHIGQLLGKDTSAYTARADRLAEKLEQDYWDEELGAYIDSAVSGRRTVNRHANIFAIRHGFATGERVERIVRHVLDNEKVPAIKTPYFKFYELESLGLLGRHTDVLSRMRAYWGGMLALGATTFWEEYDPTLPSNAHYDMYQIPYDKSLCHAWGASPIYLLGRFFLGVSPTADGYARYMVCPHLGDLTFIEGDVPTPNGDIHIYLDKSIARVRTAVPGGTLMLDGKQYTIPTDRELTITR